MATTVTSVQAAFTLLSTGPQESVALQAVAGDIIYRLAASLPAASEEGHFLPNGAGHTITLDTGENLYGRSAANNTAKAAVTT